MKIQSLAIHNPWPAGIPQFYSECAQITLTGGTGAGTPSPLVAIPGYISDTDPGYTVNIYSDVSSIMQEVRKSELTKCLVHQLHGPRTCCVVLLDKEADRTQSGVIEAV